VRSFVPGPSPPADLYVEAGGNDDNDGLTVGTAFATITRALREVPTQNPGEVVVNVGAGSFGMPALVMLPNNIKLQGTESDGVTCTVVADVAVGVSTAIVLDVAGLGLATTDLYRGQRIEWLGGPLAGQRGWIYRNDAAVGPNTRVYISVDGLMPGSIGALVQFKLISLDTELTHAAPTTYASAAGMTIEKVRITGQAGLWSGVWPATLRAVSLELRNVKVQHGTLAVDNCYIRSGGGVSQHGLLRADRGGVVELRASVVDGTDALIAERTVVVARWGHILASLQTVFRRILAVGGAGEVFRDPNGAPYWMFEPGPWTTGTEPTGTATCTIGFAWQARGGYIELPDLYGEVQGFAVSASGFGLIELGSSSALRTALVPNAVSADSGLSNVSDVGELRIRNGSPDERRVMPDADADGLVGTPGARWADIRTASLTTGTP
jgi:hypothetical protein